MIISDEQIKMIANSIVYDVRHYIMEHYKEYEEFLLEEQQEKLKEETESDENEEKEDNK